MENLIFMGFALFFIILMAVHIYYTNTFFTRLKQAHENVWQELGEPRWKIQFGDDSFKNAMQYIRQKKFTELQDPELDTLYEKIKRIENAALATAIVIVSATLVNVIQGK